MKIRESMNVRKLVYNDKKMYRHFNERVQQWEPKVYV